MRKKRLFAFSLMLGLLATFITLQVNSPRPASAQDAKVKQGGFSNGCSDSVIDALDECIQKRFSKVDTIFGFSRVSTIVTKGHKRLFQAETEMERAVIADLERSGAPVVFYLCGDDPHYGPKNPEGIQSFDSLFGPVVITPMASNWEPPEGVAVWKEAKNALRSFKGKDQYEFTVEKWAVAARPIRARESCLECHRHQTSIRLSDNPESYRRLKAGDVLGIAMYAYARKQ
jgi:hypothetical protein